MIKRWALSALYPLLFLVATHAPAFAGTAEIERVRSAIDVLNKIMSIPENCIPPSLLRDAYGIAIIPGVIKGGFFVGARYGKGVLCVRRDGGDWGNPLFISAMGGSFGFQFGAQSVDVILVFKSNRSVEAITGGKFTVGADAAVAAGPVGRYAEASTDIMLKSEIYSYSRSRGLFAGVSLEGASLQVDYKSNSAFYNMAGILPIQILKGQDLDAPPVASDLRNALSRHATL